jgi:chromosomal replication initiator protein
MRPWDIAKAACFNIPIEMLLSKSRKTEIVRARYICMYLMRLLLKNNSNKNNSSKYLPISLAEIGLFFKLDHTSIMHGIQTIKDDMTVTAYRQAVIEEINNVKSFL